MAQKNKVALTKAMLENQPKLADIFDLAPFKHNFVKNYTMTTHKTDGDQVWERERVLFIKKISEDSSLQSCSRLSIYSSFIELAVSGLTLNDDQVYIIPYKSVATFQIGWRGRLEQISRLERISEVGQPTVVYESDTFDFELGSFSANVTKHKRTTHDHGDDDPITHVYLAYKEYDQTKFIIMERNEVLSIRDNYSSAYEAYLKKKNSGDWKDWMDLPMWVSAEPEAFKKTIVKRLYKELPKSARQSSFDKELQKRPDEETIEVDYGIISNDAEGEAPKENVSAPPKSEGSKNNKVNLDDI